MPAMPSWASGARIVFDQEYNLAFVRTERRGLWTPYFVSKRGLALAEGVEGRRDLALARKAVLEAVGNSLGLAALSLHPGARDKHMVTSGSRHLCGAPFVPFATVYTLNNVTCKLCLAVMHEDVLRRTAEVGPEAVEAARQVVRDTRELNNLGKLVTGEAATEHEL